MGYIYANNGFQGGTLLNRSNFESLFPFVYFDLTKQKKDIKDGVKNWRFIMNYLLMQTLIIISTLWYFTNERQKSNSKEENYCFVFNLRIK